MCIDIPASQRIRAPLSHRAAEMREHYGSADVVVVGAGVFGCAIAWAMGCQGRSVILLEKSMKQPDRIVGELLQPGGVAALEQLGMRECLEEIDAVRVLGYDVIYHGEEVRIPYPEPKEGQQQGAEEAAEESRTDERRGTHKRKRPEGRSFHHGRFISRLRQKVLTNANVTVVEATATQLVRCEYTGHVLGVEATIAAPRSAEEEAEGKKSTQPPRDVAFFGGLTIIADGYNSKFRAAVHAGTTPISKSRFWALELQDADLPMPLHGHVLLSDNAPVLLYQIGAHETRALIDIPADLPSASPAAGGVKGHLRKVVLPSLPKRVQPAFEAALERQSLRSMPNSFLPATTNKSPGLIILGDALNMRHPLTGGGMTVALNDAVLLSDLLSPTRVPDLDDPAAVLPQLQTFHWRRKAFSSTINILAQALYALFAANDAQLRALQRGCFAYFQRGGECVDGPVGLLAGIIRQPLVLFYHFFAVALLAIWLYIVKGGAAVAMPLRAVGSVGVFYKACVVLFPYIFSELQA